jgi:4-amino-4-deoxy-L-arabinose transferase-like glycosyltransferase
MLGKNKKGGWIAIGVAVGTSIAVATKEPVWVAVGIAFGAAVILASTLKFSKTEKNKE